MYQENIFTKQVKRCIIELSEVVSRQHKRRLKKNPFLQGLVYLLYVFGRYGSLPLDLVKKDFFFAEKEFYMNQIETKFYEALSFVLNRGFVTVQDKRLQIMGHYNKDSFFIRSDEKTIFVTVKAQPKEEYFQGYVPDFAIFINGLASGLVVEIDGHEWHEKTKEQAKADRGKDRVYLKNGFIPVRFTGSEVYHDAKKCVDELFEILYANYQFWEYDSLRNELKEANTRADEYEKSFMKEQRRLSKLKNRV